VFQSLRWRAEARASKGSRGKPYQTTRKGRLPLLRAPPGRMSCG
jgi:hypothetical protein